MKLIISHIYSLAGFRIFITKIRRSLSLSFFQPYQKLQDSRLRYLQNSIFINNNLLFEKQCRIMNKKNPNGLLNCTPNVVSNFWGAVQIINVTFLYFTFLNFIYFLKIRSTCLHYNFEIKNDLA